MKNIDPLLSAILALVIISLFPSCSEQPSAQRDKTSNHKESVTSLPLPDSLIDPKSYYYLSHLSTRDFADLYLSDSIYTNDYKKLYDCLDSLNSKNSQSRKFYEKVLIHALNDLEVVFHQNMAPHLIKNVLGYPNEFKSRISKMTDHELNFYAQALVGIRPEYINSNPDFIKTIKQLASESQGQLKNRLDTVLSIIEEYRNSSFE